MNNKLCQYSLTYIKVALFAFIVFAVILLAHEDVSPSQVETLRIMQKAFLDSLIWPITLPPLLVVFLLLGLAFGIIFMNVVLAMLIAYPMLLIVVILAFILNDKVNF